MNAVNDQVAEIGAVVVPGTVRDSLYILDTVLNLDAGPKPEMISAAGRLGGLLFARDPLARRALTYRVADVARGSHRLIGYRR